MLTYVILSSMCSCVIRSEYTFLTQFLKEAINTLPFLYSMNLTLFRITFSHWHKPIAAVTPGCNHDIKTTKLVHI